MLRTYDDTRADEYIHRCLADALGYRLANMIIEAAKAPPARTDLVKEEHQAAISTEQGLRNPRKFLGSKSGYLFEEDVWIEVSLVHNLRKPRLILYCIPYVQLYDDFEQEFFYYNLATADSQWSQPKQYRAYEITPRDFF